VSKNTPTQNVASNKPVAHNVADGPLPGNALTEALGAIEGGPLVEAIDGWSAQGWRLFWRECKTPISSPNARRRPIDKIRFHKFLDHVYPRSCTSKNIMRVRLESMGAITTCR